MTDTWHDTNAAPHKGCEHCEEGKGGGHYHCTQDKPCQDCINEGMSAAEDIAAGYDPGFPDDDGLYERDNDLGHPWNMNA